MPLPDITDRPTLVALLAPTGIEVLGDPSAIGDEYGYSSARASVPIRLPDGGDAPAVIKVWDAAEIGLDEIDFYDTWAPKLPIRLATFYGGHATNDLGLLILEDLKPERQGDAEFLFERPDACEIARTLAAIHLATVEHPNDLSPHGAARPDDWHDSRRISFVERFGLPKDVTVRSIVIHSEAVDHMATRLLIGTRAGLLHGDVHQDNVVFLEGGVPVLLDWARPRWGPAAHDLAALLVGATATSDYAAVIDSFRETARVSQSEIHGAIIRQLVTGTLGIARWHPQTDRQERLVTANVERVRAAAAWLQAEQPDLMAQFSS